MRNKIPWKERLGGVAVAVVAAWVVVSVWPSSTYGFNWKVFWGIWVAGSVVFWISLSYPTLKRAFQVLSGRTFLYEAAEAVLEPGWTTIEDASGRGVSGRFKGYPVLLRDLASGELAYIACSLLFVEHPVHHNVHIAQEGKIESPVLHKELENLRRRKFFVEFFSFADTLSLKTWPRIGHEPIGMLNKRGVLLIRYAASLAYTPAGLLKELTCLVELIEKGI